MAKITPREEGYRAFQRLGRTAVNPYRGDDRSALQWFEGWAKGAREEKARQALAAQTERGA